MAKKGKHPGGRPSDYSKEILARTLEYQNQLPTDEVIHTIEGLSDYLGVARSTIYEWAKDKDKEEFSDIIERIMSKQGKSLVNKSLSGQYNPTIAKVLLTKHGYREGIDQTTNDKDLPTPIYGGKSTKRNF